MPYFLFRILSSMTPGNIRTTDTIRGCDDADGSESGRGTEQDWKPGRSTSRLESWFECQSGINGQTRLEAGPESIRNRSK